MNNLSKDVLINTDAMTGFNFVTRLNTIPEKMTKGNALGLGRKIHNYWREYGYDVKIRITGEGETKCVRSDMVNGLPRGWK